MLNISKIAGLTALAVLALPFGAQAAITEFNLQSGGDAAVSSGSGYGNSLTFSENGIQLRVTGYGATDTGIGDDYDLDSAQLGRYSEGLGVCNRDEGTNCSNPRHQVDNYGADDFVLFKFDTVVDFAQIVIRAFGSDTDISYWIGTTGLTSLAGLEPFEFGGQGFGGQQNVNGSYTNGFSTFNLSGSGNALVFAARVDGGCCQDDDDYFKIKTLRVEKPADEVSEPAILGLVGFGLLGVAAATRRRRAA